MAEVLIFPYFEAFCSDVCYNSCSWVSYHFSEFFVGNFVEFFVGAFDFPVELFGYLFGCFE